MDNIKEQPTIETPRESQTQAQLQECVTQRDEWKDRALRISAEFENYKKRSDKERVLWMTNAQSSVLTDLVNIVDDFDRAFEQLNAAGNVADHAQWVTGFQMIHKALGKMLEKYGVKEIQDTKHFNPQLHEAIMQTESPDHASGDIVKVLQKGYMFKDQVLRPAKVSVAK